MNILYTLLIICPKPEIINNTNVWTKRDQITLDHAKLRCKELFNDAPCLKRFVKKEELVYNVICGEII